MKIIFLDIDGVLNSSRSFVAGLHRTETYQNKDDPYYVKLTTCTIDPIAVDLINKILRDFDDAYIVLSSSHRKNFYKIKDRDQKLVAMQQYLTSLGLIGARLIDWTPSLDTRRGGEIKHWLTENKDVVDAYAIVDDSSDMLEEQEDNFVHVNGHIGLSFDDYKKITRLFGKEDSAIICL